MCINYKKEEKKRERAYMSGFGETKKQAWQNVNPSCCINVVSLYSTEICLEIFIIKSFQVFSFSIQSFVEELFLKSTKLFGICYSSVNFYVYYISE